MKLLQYHNLISKFILGIVRFFRKYFNDNGRGFYNYEIELIYTKLFGTL